MSVFRNQWFDRPGAYVLVDGQFGSTGKGLVAGFIAEECRNRITKLTTNAGPNSGHTAYFDNRTLDVASGSIMAMYDKIVTQQLPVASVFLDKMGIPRDTIINAGAIVDPDILYNEIAQWCGINGSRVLIHPLAALITPNAKEWDQKVVNLIAGTGKGIGPAIANKIMRLNGKDGVADKVFPSFLPGDSNYYSWDDLWDWSKDRVFVETAQGFSLGINSSRFYPCTTSRECTVMQALADARIPAQMLRKVVSVFRTYPIRVGNTANSSGDWYPDQEELTWEELGLEPELTTVTKRVRRIATWSRIQFRESIAANRPDVLFLNFCNYLSMDRLSELVNDMLEDYSQIMGRPDELYLGFGPYSETIKTYRSVFGRELGQ